MGGGGGVIDGDLLFGYNIRAGSSDNTDAHSEDGADEVMLSVEAKRFNLGSIRAENLVSQSESPSGAFAQTPGGL